jgi:glycosyltransferase involved in cell wall biosynthesis
MKVVIVYSFAIHPGVHKLAGTLAKNGHDVKLLVWDRDKKLPKLGKADSFTIHRFRLKAPYGKLTVLLFHPLWWLYELYFILKQKPDVVHACNFDTLPSAIIAKLVRRTKLCYSILDPYGSAYPGPVPSIVRKLITFIEKSGLSLTDTLFMVSESIYEDMKSARIKKLVYIYNSPEDYPITEPIFPRSSDFSLFYAGWMAESRGLREIVDALSGMDEVRLVMAGKEIDKSIIEHAKAKLKNFEYLGWITYQEVIRRSLEADVLFVFYDPTQAGFKYSTPNKVFEAMMCSKPIIINDGLAASKIVGKENFGFVVPYGDVNAIKQAVLKLKNDPDLRKRLGENGRRAYDTSYSWKIMESRLVEAYRGLER